MAYHDSSTPLLTTAVEVQPLSDRQVASLMAPLREARVAKLQKGRGPGLSYLEIWDVRAALIKFFGYGGFNAECIHTEIIDISYPDESNKRKAQVSVFCTVRLTIHQLGCVYTESAASVQTGSQGVGDVADFAIKTAESDALKRAAVNLGTQFGLSLYNSGDLNDVVKITLAPGNEFDRGVRLHPTQAIDPNLPATPVPSPEPQPADADEGTQEVPAAAPVQLDIPDPVRMPGVTPQQRADNEALVARALAMNAERQEPTGPAVLEDQNVGSTT